MVWSKPQLPESFSYIQTMYDMVVHAVKAWLTELLKALVDYESILYLINEITLSFTSLLLSTVVLTSDATLGWKVLGSVNLVAALAMMMRRLHVMYNEFDVARAMESVAEYFGKTPAEDVVHPNNAEGELHWMNSITAALVATCSAIVAGCGFCARGVGGIGEYFRTIHFTKLGVTTLAQLVEEAIDWISGNASDKHYGEKEEMKQACDRALEYLRMTLPDIASDNTTQQGMHKLMGEINDILRTSKATDAAPMRNNLGCLLRELNKRLAAVHAMPTGRQTTIGVFFTGNPGIGKSSLVRHMSGLLAKDFDSSPNVYNMVPSVNFCTPYRNEDFAIVDEFGASMAPSDIVAKLNVVVSGDPCNIEAAFEKEAPCKLQAVFITSNKSTPDIPELRDTSIPAFWSRYLKFEVIDPSEALIKDRRALHRLPDFSHLKFKLLSGPESGTDALKFTKSERVLSIQDVHELIAFSIAYERREYALRLFKEYGTEVPSKVRDHPALKPLAGSFTAQYNEGLLTPNSGGRDFITIRLQGPPRTGKTTTALSLSAHILSLTKSKFSETSRYTEQVSKEMKEFQPLKVPCVYVMDDWVGTTLDREQSQLLNSMMNETDPSSIFIITTNDELPLTTWRHAKCATALGYALPAIAPQHVLDASIYDHWYPGLLRRVGLERGYFSNNRFTYTVEPDTASTYNLRTTGLYTLKNERTTKFTVLEKLKNLLIKQASMIYDIEFLNTEPTLSEEDVDIALFAPTIPALLSKISTKVGATSLFLFPKPSFGIYVSDRVKKNFDSKGNVRPDVPIRLEDFTMNGVFSSDTSDGEKLKEIAVRMAKNMRGYWDDITFRCVIGDTKEILYYSKNVLYFYKVGELDYAIRDDKLVLFQGRNLVVDPLDFAYALTEERIHLKFRGTLENAPIEDYLEVQRIYNNMEVCNITNAFRTKVVCELVRLQRVNNPAYMAQYSFCYENKLMLLAIACGAALAVGGTAFGVSKLWKAMTTANIFPNAFANTGSTPPVRASERNARRSESGMDPSAAPRKTFTVYDTATVFGGEAEQPKPNSKRPDSHYDNILAVNSARPRSEYDNILKANHVDINPGMTDDDMQRAVLYARGGHIEEKQWPYRPNATIVKNHFERKPNAVELVPGKYLVKSVLGTTAQIDTNVYPHEHICKACGCLYSHVHYHNPMREHRQHDQQCPNQKCIQYHRGNNNRQALLLEENYTPDKLTPNSATTLTRMMGQEYQEVREVLVRFFAALPDQQRTELYEYLQSDDWVRHREGSKIFKKHPMLHNIIKSIVVPNMLSECDMINCEDTEYQKFAKILRPSYVLVECGGRKCYGLHYKDNYFVTVAHLFEHVGEQVVLSSAGSRYGAAVAIISRDRDLAVVKSHSNLGLKAASKHFIRDNKNLPIVGTYMHMDPGAPMVSIGKLEYREYQEFHEILTADVNYAPCVDVMQIRVMGLEVPMAVRPGDCGFPFLGKIAGSLKVLGIHNAYKQHSTIYGTFLSTDYLDNLLANALVPNAVHTSNISIANLKTDNGVFKVAMPMEYHTAFEHLLPETRIPPVPYLRFLGYSESFYAYQPLNFKHRSHSLELENKRTTLPAAFSTRYIRDYTKVPLNLSNKHDPILAEVYKYGVRETNFDVETFNEAIMLAKDYFFETYGTFKVLTEFETLNGFHDPKRGYLPNVDIKTSAGPYAKYFFKQPLKKQCLENCGTEERPLYKFADTPLGRNLQNHYKSYISELENRGVFPLVVSQDTAKVEFLPEEKAKAGKVRLFNVLDLPVNMVLKRYFGGLVAKIMGNEGRGWIAMGHNPYVFSTELHQCFQQVDGELFSTDFKGFDKSLQAPLIRGAVEVFLSGLDVDPELKELLITALSNMLCNAIHVLDGSVYVVSQGNESGTFVTTLLNSGCVIILTIYSFLLGWKSNPETAAIKVTLKELVRNMALIVLGDDRGVKFSKMIKLTMADLILHAKQFGMECTPAKDLDDETPPDTITFCSRALVYDEKERVVYPQLKKSSIIGLLHWFATFTPEQIIQNLTGALFEAAMHTEKFYNSVRRDCLVLCKEFAIPLHKLAFTNYQHTRQRLRSMVRSDEQYQQISELANRRNVCVDNDTNERILYALVLTETKQKDLSGYDCHDSASESISLEMADSSNNPIGHCNEILARAGDPGPTFRVESTGPAHCPTFTYILTYRSKEFVGEGSSKADAKKHAYAGLLVFLQENLVVNASIQDQVDQANAALAKAGPRFLALTIEAQLATARTCSSGKNSVIVYTRRDPSGDVEHLGELSKYFCEGLCYILNTGLQKRVAPTAATMCYLKYPGTAYNPVTGDVTLSLDETKQHYSIRDVDATDDIDVLDRLPGTPVQPEIEDMILYQRILQQRAEVEIQKLMLKQKKATNECVEDAVRELAGLVEKLDSVAIHPNASTEAPMIGVIPNNDPVVAPVQTTLDSDNALTKPIIMNDTGPLNNFLRVGGIEFDIMDLNYNQFVATQTQKTISDSSTVGSIIAQVCYDPCQNEFVSPYMQQLLLLHERYAGDWLLKITCPGNPGLTCSVGAAWSPRKIKESTVNLAEMTKYAFFTQSASTPINQTIVLRDARKNDFYREVVRKSGPLDKDDLAYQDHMPHVVIYLETPAQSVFTEKKSTYLTFFSKFASQKDAMICPGIKPFIMANPAVAVKYSSSAGFTLNF